MGDTMVKGDMEVTGTEEEDTEEEGMVGVMEEDIGNLHQNQLQLQHPIQLHTIVTELHTIMTGIMITIGKGHRTDTTTTGNLTTSKQ